MGGGQSSFNNTTSASKDVASQAAGQVKFSIYSLLNLEGGGTLIELLKEYKRHQLETKSEHDRQNLEERFYKQLRRMIDGYCESSTKTIRSYYNSV